MKKFWTTLFVAFLCFSIIERAHALPQLYVSDGITEITITDGSAEDQGALEGFVMLNSAIGNFWVNVTTGITKPILGSVDYPIMDLNSVNVTSAGGGTLTIKFTDTDFIMNAGNPLAGFSSLVGGTTSGTVNLSTYMDYNNTPFGTGTLLSDLGPFSAGAFSSSDSQRVDPTNGLFSLTIVAEISHTNAGISSFDAEINPVPEPATMLLLGTGLMGLAGIGRKKFHKKA